MSQRVKNSSIVIIVNNKKITFYPEEVRVNMLSVAFSYTLVKEVIDSSYDIFKEFDNYQLM